MQQPEAPEKRATFDQPEAYIADINYTSGRKLNRSLIERLATCEYITEHRDLFITGATGSGKTYMACAFGMEACKQRYKTKYVRLPASHIRSGWAAASSGETKMLPFSAVSDATKFPSKPIIW